MDVDNPRITERRNPASEGIDTMSAEEIVSLMSREDEKVVAAVRSAIPSIARAAELVSDVVKRGGRVFYQGAGTSGRIAVLDAAEWTPTFGIDPDRVVALIAGGDEALRSSVEGAEDRADLGAEDLRTNGFSDSDLLDWSLRQRSDSVRARWIRPRQRDRGQERGGDLQSGFSLPLGRRRGDRSRSRPGSRYRLDPPQGGHGSEDGPEYDQHGRDGARERDLRKLDGGPDGGEREADQQSGIHDSGGLGRVQGRSARRACRVRRLDKGRAALHVPGISPDESRLLLKRSDGSLRAAMAAAADNECSG